LYTTVSYFASPSGGLSTPVYRGFAPGHPTGGFRPLNLPASHFFKFLDSPLVSPSVVKSLMRLFLFVLGTRGVHAPDSRDATTLSFPPFLLSSLSLLPVPPFDGSGRGITPREIVELKMLVVEI